LKDVVVDRGMNGWWWKKIGKMMHPLVVWLYWQGWIDLFPDDSGSSESYEKKKKFKGKKGKGKGKGKKKVWLTL
jgi:hypothetical protein